MPLPTKLKTWQLKENQVISGASVVESYQKLQFAIIQSLTTFGTLPWTWVGSSNAVAAGMDGVNRITSYSNVNWAATGSGARSWAVLKQTGLSSNAQMLLHHQTSGLASAYYQMSIYVSPNAGFTGASTTARPTATDEMAVLAAASWMVSITGSGFTTILHVWQSTDGQSTRLVIHRSGYPVFVLFIEKVINPSTGWTYPIVAGCAAAGLLIAPGAPSYSNFLHTANSHIYSTADCTAFITGESFSNSTTMTVGERLTDRANVFTGEWPMGPMGVACEVLAGYGRHGSIADMYWGTANNSEGYTYKDVSNADSREWVQFGQFILPWVGGTASNSVPVIL